MGHFAFMILQIRFLRFSISLTCLIIFILFFRRIYQRFCGKNPMVTGFLWMLLPISLFAGKSVLLGSSWERAIWVLADEFPYFAGTYWSIAGLLVIVYMLRINGLIRKIRKYEDVQVDSSIQNVFLKRSPYLLSPFTVGFRRRYIVLPKDYQDRYLPHELEMLICHEEAHIKNCHMWLFLIFGILRCICFLNPFVYLACIDFQTDMEVLCDTVVARRYPVDAYGKLILKSLNFPVGTKTLERMNFFFSRKECCVRIEALVHERLDFAHRRRTLILILISVLFGSVLFLSTSTWRIEGGGGVKYIMVPEDEECTELSPLLLKKEQEKKVVVSENQKEVVLNLKEIRKIARKQGYQSGGAYVILGDYRVGAQTYENARQEINLYDAQSQYITIDKKFGTAMKFVQYL